MAIVFASLLHISKRLIKNKAIKNVNKRLVTRQKRYSEDKNSRCVSCAYSFLKRKGRAINQLPRRLLCNLGHSTKACVLFHTCRLYWRPLFERALQPSQTGSLLQTVTNYKLFLDFPSLALNVAHRWIRRFTHCNDLRRRMGPCALCSGFRNPFFSLPPSPVHPRGTWPAWKAKWWERWRISNFSYGLHQTIRLGMNFNKRPKVIFIKRPISSLFFFCQYTFYKDGQIANKS